MPEVSALNHFKCLGCGATAEWNPEKLLVSCPYCGTALQSEHTITGDAPEENCLVSALETYEAEHQDWLTKTQSVRCQNCNAISVFTPDHQAKRCEFCGSPSLIDVSDVRRSIRPDGVLPFTVSQSQVRESVRAWFGEHRWAPNNFKKKAMTDQVHGVYIPYWTFDAHVDCQWKGERGTEHQSTDSDGNSTTTVHWERMQGEFHHFFDDALVPASTGVDGSLIFQIEPFPTQTDLQPYHPKFLSGWVAEQYQIDLKIANEAANERMEAALHEMVARRIGGDRQRNIQTDNTYREQTFKYVLLPIWLLHYTYQGRSFQVIVNGCTGYIAGKTPVSIYKVIGAILLGILALIALIYFSDFVDSTSE